MGSELSMGSITLVQVFKIQISVFDSIVYLCEFHLYYRGFMNFSGLECCALPLGER